MSNCCACKTGFSLLELIGAVAILSIGIVSALQAFSFSARVTGLSGDIARGVFLAQDKMQELEFKEKSRLIAKEAPVAQDKSGKFDWKCSLTEDSDSKLYMANFEITWQRANKTEKITLLSLLR